MTSSIYLPGPLRANGRYKSRPPNGSSLPQYSAAVEDKMHRRRPSWMLQTHVRIPGLRARRLRLYILNPLRLHHSSVARFGRKRGTIVFCFILLLAVFSVFALTKRFATRQKSWPAPFISDSTLVYKRADLQRIWQWEISSGHYPSRRSIPEALGFRSTQLDNPGLPPRRIPAAASSRSSQSPYLTTTKGTGAKRIYLDVQSQPPNVAYPPRPVPGSIADLDIVMEHCDFSQKKYVRDCLEVLRVGAGLDNGKRLRRGSLDDWKYIYMESNSTIAQHASRREETPVHRAQDRDLDIMFPKRRTAEWEQSPLALPPPIPHTPYLAQQAPCEPEQPRIFHMFWTGPFTDKPYVSLLSFLFTQNTGIHTHDTSWASSLCRPTLWMWINPGPAAASLKSTATHDMFEELKSSPWASPFLHPRFRDVIQFRLWNTTEQLDSVPEIKNEWRSQETLFNSGGHMINVPRRKQAPAGTDDDLTSAATRDDDILNRTGSKSSSSYDRLSVILSDIARFVLCHRFGGTYLDADTIFLRDWEELWGWKGAFAYRWSRLEKYNTAVLRLNKGSALGTFLFRTALKNEFDFHPMVVSRYLKEASLEGLLLRLPDALFDSAWLNTEHYQRDRPPQPYFTSFGDFFFTPPSVSAAPQALGFDGFYKGAFSYHFHNGWWDPFDPSRNWPDLGEKFIKGEQAWRSNEKPKPSSSASPIGDKDARDKRDLDWGTVLKRTFESYIRGERPNMYGEWIDW